ncbi:MAG: hypothetical protein ACPGUV_08415 [Polyangiales bacterium]
MLPACAGPAAERDAPRQRQAPSAATADSALLAQVGDMRITASDLQALQPSAAAMPVRQLLRRLEDFALLVQAAKAGGYATDPRVRWAHKQALAQQLLRAQVEQGRDPQVQPQAAAVRLRRLLWRAPVPSGAAL